MAHPRYRFLLRSVYSAVIQSGLGGSDLRLLAEQLRRGQLPDELAYMLEQVSKHFKDERRKLQVESGELAALEKSIKRKRMSKAELVDILRTMRPGSISSIEGSTVRTLLKQFLETASLAQIDKLKGVLDTNGKIDPYLKGISER